jgi:uncharacterized protein YjiK
LHFLDSQLNIKQSLQSLAFGSKKDIFMKAIKPIKSLYSVSLILAIIISSFSIWGSTKTFAQDNPPYIWLARVIEIEQTEMNEPYGLVFSPRLDAFYAVDAREWKRSSMYTDLFELTVSAFRAGAVRITPAIQNPINMAYDDKANRLLIYQAAANQLLEAQGDQNGRPDPTSLISHDASRFGIQNAQGLTVDPTNGNLFILDAAEPRIVRVSPGSSGNFDAGVITVISLGTSGIVAPRGIAFDSITNHLFVIGPTEKMLYELTLSGQLVASRDLSQFNLKDTRGMVFAPSGDQTDDPAEMSLYVADSGLPESSAAPIIIGGVSTPIPPSPGQIVEFSLVQPFQVQSRSFAPLAVEAGTFTSSLVRTTNMAAISPPSPDPSGLAFLPNSNRLMVSDGEVEETVSGVTHFQGANVWELNLNGSVIRTANISKVAPTVVPMTNEPTGVAWNPTNGHYYFSDDGGARSVWDLNPGSDGLVGTSDDTWTTFSTAPVGSGDPEGIAYDTWNNRIFVADGVNAEIYQFTTTGTFISQFDVQTYGVVDPEGVEFNPDNGTLFVLSNGANPVIIETTLSGTLLQTIDVSASNEDAPAGLAYAPASDGSGAKRFYIVDRGVDNNNDPDIVDGLMYEMTAPFSGTLPSPTPTFTSSPGPSPTSTLTATSTPTSTFTPTPAPTQTFTPPPGSSNNPLYASFGSNGTVAGVSFSDEDILRFDGSTWSLFFDGTDVGVGTDVFAFYLLDPDSILLSFSAAVTVGGQTYAPTDIVRFDATSLGSVTAGTFSLYFNGIDVGLDTTSENIDALEILPDGRILISTTSNPTVSGLTGLADEDILAFTPATLGAATSGTWTWYFDGSDVALSQSSSEDIDALGVASNGNIYLSTTGVFSVTGASGDDEDVFSCTPTSLGSVTACNYSPALYFDGSTWSLAANDLDALGIYNLGPLPTATASLTPTLTLTPSTTPTPTMTSTPTVTLTQSLTPTQTSTPTVGPSPTNTLTPTTTMTFTPTNTPDPTNTPTMTLTPTETFTPTPITEPGSPLTFIAEADAHVREAKPTSNFGTNTSVSIDGDAGAIYAGYFRFTVTGVTGSVQSAVLRVFASDSSVDGPAVSAVDNTWTETSITWNNRPAPGGVIADVGAISGSTWVEYDVTLLVTGDGAYSFVLSTANTDGVTFSSREGSQPPQLVVTTAP